MSGFEVSGKLLVKFDEQKMSDKFRKRDFILEIKNGNYSEQIKFQLTQDRCVALDDHRENDEIKVHFNLRGKPFQKGGETIYFTNLEAWRIEKVKANASSDDMPPPPEEDFSSIGTEDEILPF
ncbi:MAG: DUF3127 domain-containing protein [Bacteroidetes bacterium]|nr:MAG: DUF3127 domain-containing protein [Bacteroidota bacterium]